MLADEDAIAAEGSDIVVGAVLDVRDGLRERGLFPLEDGALERLK